MSLVNVKEVVYVRGCPAVENPGDDLSFHLRLRKLKFAHQRIVPFTHFLQEHQQILTVLLALNLAQPNFIAVAVSRGEEFNYFMNVMSKYERVLEEMVRFYADLVPY